jgi:hypothetical protein
VTKTEDNPCQLVAMWPIEVVQKNLIYMISELLSREETMMKHSSRVQWLAKGDRNTAYFHTKARDRARTNKIVSLRNDDGTYASSQVELEVMANSFYNNLFTALLR